MYLENVVKSTKNGCCTRNDAVDTSSVGGDWRIVASKFGGSLSIAENVVACSPNKRALVCATGETVPINPFNAPKNRVNPVAGADKYCATGRKCKNNAGNAAIVSFNEDPRAANTSPNPAKSRLTAGRVLESNIVLMSSNCTGTSVRDTCIVPPSGNTLLDLPRFNSKYLSPNTDRGLIVAVESTGTRPLDRLSFNVTSAPTRPSGSTTGRESDTNPTRNAPSSTSLPETNAAPLAKSTFNSRVGTNGNPLFALYARNTATIAINTVTAPINTGFANAERCTSAGATNSATPRSADRRWISATGSNGGRSWPRSSARFHAFAAPSQSPPFESRRPNLNAPKPSPR